MTELRNTSDAGTNGTTVTTGNSGGLSGNAWDVVSIGATGAIAFDSGKHQKGGLSTKFTAGATPANSYVAWSTSLTSTTIPKVYFRAYLYLTGVPTNTPLLIGAYGGGALCGAVHVDVPFTDPVLRIVDSTATTVATGSVTLPLNQWIRIEGFVTGSLLNGEIEAKVYTQADGAQPDEVLNSGPGAHTNAAVDSIRFGFVGSLITPAANTSYWMDGIAASDTEYPGPSAEGTQFTTTSGSPAFGLTADDTMVMRDSLVITFLSITLEDTFDLSDRGFGRDLVETIEDSMALTDTTNRNSTLTGVYRWTGTILEAAEGPYRTPIDEVRVQRGVTLFKDASGVWHTGRNFGSEVLDAAIVVYRGGYDNVINPIYVAELLALGIPITAEETT